jgi:predicted nuclease of predicted toxin-antitoxin system
LKLLFDQNLSRHLVDRCAREFPGSAHVTQLGLDRASDIAIWRYAGENGYTIISKDSDFHHLSFRFGPPPKAVWLDVGNRSTSEISGCLETNLSRLRTFLADEESALLVLTIK